MTDLRANAALSPLGQSLRDAHSATTKALKLHLHSENRAALLARLGGDGNAEALWEQVTIEIAQRILPQDEVANLAADWLPSLEALRELGARALDVGANPLAPQLLPAEKVRLLMRLSRPAKVAFETYALAREVAASVVAQLP